MPHPASIIPQRERSARIPPLEAGDHLTRDEFERRYSAMPALKKAELIEGVVHMPAAAVRWSQHASPSANLITWMTTYCGATPGVSSGDNGSIRLDLDNEPQPDAAMIILPGFGGQVRISDDDYIEGAPELVAEVSENTVSIDLHAKRRVYLRNGVREYIVWRVMDRALDWFALRQGQYVPIPAQPDGTARSETFPGLWLDVESMLDLKLPAVLKALDRGLQSPEHASFVEFLQAVGSRQ
jgi:Uma2 family endonuclease